MKCPICGLQNAEGVKFCERCLSALDIFMVNPEEEGIYCNQGHWNPIGAKFCSICGEPIKIEPILLSPYVLVEKDSGKIISLPLNEEEITKVIVGRKSTEFKPDVDLSELTLSATVSRRHAMLIIDPESKSISIQDLGSTNGTYLNGERLEPNKIYKVNPGDVISFSKKLHLTFEVKKQ
ncbi:MAG TPA: FHA domain-containing protein [Candidatus Hydrothermia bacterium]|nr:FHA domain-containing protein [Candidatus Hydrothermae bacterium]MDD3649173.1 FHA domain-containing protein [Candidatus Hydrothermia bacterium]MDD5572158.1 FHA domain-containing protein [Candidatus Hydrothermia bacterium]HOK23369.1 FHA domain-containing protein [Candidatus Hydrothermia bacterium]HOL24179.1 FHA domain-containing protein [Candidatus Hydrothermia bacterium]